MHEHHQPINLVHFSQSNKPLVIKAFTLIELVMVIVLLGILAGLVGPRFFSLRAYQEKFFVQDFLSALRYSRLTAEVTNCRVQVNVLANGFELKQNVNCNLIPLSDNFSFTVKRPSEPDQPYLSTEKPPSLAVTSVDSASAPANTFYILPSGRVTNGAGNPSDIVLTFSGADVTEAFRLEQGSGYAH